MMLRTMTLNDEVRAIDTVVLAFAEDPMTRWAWPEAHQFMTAMPKAARAFGGAAFSQDSAFCSEDCVGVALWLRPGVQPDEERLLDIMQTTASFDKRDAALAIFEQMAAYHPAQPHWYLPLIGVDPAHQGRGHGDTLMRHALEIIDGEHSPAYLESSNPRNIPFYRRHGFEELGQIQAGSSPTVVPMLRQPR